MFSLVHHLGTSLIHCFRTSTQLTFPTTLSLPILPLPIKTFTFHLILKPIDSIFFSPIFTFTITSTKAIPPCYPKQWIRLPFPTQTSTPSCGHWRGDSIHLLLLLLYLFFIFWIKIVGICFCEFYDYIFWEGCSSCYWSSLLIGHMILFQFADLLAGLVLKSAKFKRRWHPICDMYLFILYCFGPYSLYLN